MPLHPFFLNESDSRFIAFLNSMTNDPVRRSEMETLLRRVSRGRLGELIRTAFSPTIASSSSRGRIRTLVSQCPPWFRNAARQCESSRRPNPADDNVRSHGSSRRRIPAEDNGVRNYRSSSDPTTAEHSEQLESNEDPFGPILRTLEAMMTLYDLTPDEFRNQESRMDAAAIVGPLNDFFTLLNPANSGNIPLSNPSEVRQYHQSSGVPLSFNFNINPNDLSPSDPSTAGHSERHESSEDPFGPNLNTLEAMMTLPLLTSDEFRNQESRMEVASEEQLNDFDTLLNTANSGNIPLSNPSEVRQDHQSSGLPLSFNLNNLNDLTIKEEAHGVTEKTIDAMEEKEMESLECFIKTSIEEKFTDEQKKELKRDPEKYPYLVRASGLELETVGPRPVNKTGACKSKSTIYTTSKPRIIQPSTIHPVFSFPRPQVSEPSRPTIQNVRRSFNSSLPKPSVCSPPRPGNREFQWSLVRSPLRSSACSSPRPSVCSPPRPGILEFQRYSVCSPPRPSVCPPPTPSVSPPPRPSVCLPRDLLPVHLKKLLSVIARPRLLAICAPPTPATSPPRPVVCSTPKPVVSSLQRTSPNPLAAISCPTLHAIGAPSLTSSPPSLSASPTPRLPIQTSSAIGNSNIAKVTIPSKKGVAQPHPKLDARSGESSSSLSPQIQNIQAPVVSTTEPSRKEETRQSYSQQGLKPGDSRSRHRPHVKNIQIPAVSAATEPSRKEETKKHVFERKIRSKSLNLRRSPRIKSVSTAASTERDSSKKEESEQSHSKQDMKSREPLSSHTTQTPAIPTATGVFNKNEDEKIVSKQGVKSNLRRSPRVKE